LAVVKRVVDDTGISVGALAPVAERIFELCSALEWMRLANGFLRVVPRRGAVEFVERPPQDLGNENVSILVNMTPIVRQLREALFDARPDDAQSRIVLPPVGLQARRMSASIARRRP
jgi:hypothetical protein